MDLWEGQDISEGWAAFFFSLIALVYLLKTFIGVLALLFIYKFILSVVMQRSSFSTIVSGTTVIELLRFVLIWMSLALFLSLFSETAFLSVFATDGITSFLQNSIFICLLNVTFWYYNDDFSYFELKPIKKLILQTILLTFALFVMGRFGVVSIILYVLLAGYIIKNSKRNFEKSSVDT